MKNKNLVKKAIEGLVNKYQWEDVKSLAKEGK